jgi:hypothetical protein
MRHFTVEEANGLLATLTPVLNDMQRLHRELREALDAIMRFSRRAAGNGQGEGYEGLRLEHDLKQIRHDLGERLEFVQALGVHMKDIDEGIVDFPTRMFGRDVYLCWRLGEEQVAHWHDVETGFAGRQPL